MPSQLSYSFEVELAGVYPVVREDGNVFFAAENTDELVAYIPAPVMWDSATEQRETYDIAVEVKKLSAAKYEYKLTPSREWLTAAERVYPVTIDLPCSFGRITPTRRLSQANIRITITTRTAM